jgi:hypothetical protein
MIHLAILAAVILLVLWLLGLSAFSLGAFAHIFLVLAVVAIILWFLGGGLGSRSSI